MTLHKIILQRTFKVFALFSFILMNLFSVSVSQAACTAAVVAVHPINCNSSGTVEFLLTPAEPGRSFSYTGPVSGSGTVNLNTTFFSLGFSTPGAYNITFHTSAGDCHTSFTMIAATVSPFLIILFPSTSCACDGAISLSATTQNIADPISYTFTLTGANGYSSTVDTSDSSAIFNGLCGSNYHWTITATGVDPNDPELSCSVSASGDVGLMGGGPLPTASITGNTSPYNAGDPINLFGHPNPLSLTPPGPGLTYSWTGPSFTATTQNIGPITASAATAGLYSLTVCNPSNGQTNCCTTDTALVSLVPVCDLAITGIVTTTPPCVNQSNGIVQATFTGGTGNIFYQVDGGPVIQVPGNVSPFSISGISTGPHMLHMSDSLTPVCTTSQGFSVVGILCCDLSINSVTTISPACVAQSNGIVQVSFAGGTGNIFYQVDGGAVTQVPGNLSPFNISGLTGAGHSLILTDSSQPVCSVNSEFTVQSSCCLVAQLSNPQPSCANINNGSVDITVSNASGQVSYSTDGINYTNASSNPFTVFNLPAGSSTIFLQDASSTSCPPVQVSATIDTLPGPSVSFTGVLDVCGSIAPTLTANPSGGVPPYTYLWTPGNITTQTMSETGPGIYSVVVFDQNGCSGTNSIMVNADLTAAITPADPSICLNGSVLLTALPTPAGPGTYNYSWTCCNSPDVISTQPTVLATQVGTYTVTITDPHFPACKAVVPIEVVASENCGQFDPQLCCKVHDDKGAITVTITNSGTGPITGIVVSDLLPSCFTFKKGISADNWTFVNGQPVLATFNGVLQTGQTTSFTLSAKAKCGKEKCSFVVNQVTVTGIGAPSTTASCLIKLD